MINDNLRPLTIELQEEFSFFKDCKPIMDILRHRKQWLEKTVASRVEFNWRMPNASFPRHPDVERFLKSNEESMVYSTPFHDIDYARNFARKYARPNVDSSGYR
jgi:hypothetical protein